MTKTKKTTLSGVHLDIKEGSGSRGDRTKVNLITWNAINTRMEAHGELDKWALNQLAINAKEGLEKILAEERKSVKCTEDMLAQLGGES